MEVSYPQESFSQNEKNTEFGQKIGYIAVSWYNNICFWKYSPRITKEISRYTLKKVLLGSSRYYKVYIDRNFPIQKLDFAQVYGLGILIFICHWFPI